MGRTIPGGLSQYLLGLLGQPSDQTDRDLLDAFATRHDEAAFAAVMQRHGPLVWGVCRRLLRDEQDAADAFQATFFVLARKADSVAWREDAGNWLYAVALRIAQKLRAREQKLRQQHDALERAVTLAVDPEPDRETAAIVAEEVSRLPEKYRRPMILCGLQGQSYREAAAVLGWPEGTVSGRLARARELLRQRLTRRGVEPAATLPLAAVPATLGQTTLRDALPFAAGEPVASSASALANEVIRNMLLSKVKVAVGAVALLVVLSVGLVPFAQNKIPAAPAPLPRKDRFREEAAWTAPVARSLGRMSMYHHILAVSPEGQEIVIGDANKGFVFSLARGKVVRQFQTNDKILGSIQSAAISPDGKLLATVEWRDGIHLRDYQSLKVVHSIPDRDGLNAWLVRFSTDGKRLIGFSTGTKKRLWIYDLAERKDLGWPAYEERDGPKGYTREWFVGSRPLLFSVDNQTHNNPGDISGYRVWLTDPETGKKRPSLQLGPRDLFKFDVSPDGEKVVVAEPGEEPRLVDMTTGKTIRLLSGHDRWLTAAAFSPRGQLLATATGITFDGHDQAITDKRPPTEAPTDILLRDAATGRFVAKWENDKRLDFAHIGFSPDGRYLWAITAKEYELWLWGNLPTMAEKMEAIPKRPEVQKP